MSLFNSSQLTSAHLESRCLARIGWVATNAEMGQNFGLMQDCHAKIAMFRAADACISGRKQHGKC